MDPKVQEKLSHLQELIKQKEAIEREIAGVLSPERVVALPPDFSLNTEVLSLIRDIEGGEAAATVILAKLQKKYPNYGIDRKKVASSLAYLKNTKKQIDSVADKRGVYRILQNQG